MRSAMRSLIILAVVFSSAPLRADEAPHARAYLDQLQTRLELIQTDMPTITQAAEAAAASLIEGRGFGVRGDRGLANELSNRAGAMMGYDGRPGDKGDVMLCVFGVDRPGAWGLASITLSQIEGARRLKTDGSLVIGLGSTSQLQTMGLLDKAKEVCDVWLDNKAQPHNNQVHAPMQTVLNAAVAWTFQCELFAAMTRLDKVPIVRQSLEIDTRHKRWKYYGSQRFHHDRWLDPIPPAKLGNAYLDGLDERFTDIGTASWAPLAKTADKAHVVYQDTGSYVWLRPGGRYLPHHVGGWLPNDPDIFKLLTHDGSDPKLDAPNPHDLVIAVGRSETAGSYEWGEPELLRKAGHGVAWVVNGYNTQPRDLLRGETLIDLWGPVGDCLVKVQDYDTRLGPASSITSEAVLWMIAAEVSGRQEKQDKD